MLPPRLGHVYCAVRGTALYHGNPFVFRVKPDIKWTLNSVIYCGILTFENQKQCNCKDNSFNEVHHSKLLRNKHQFWHVLVLPSSSTFDIFPCLHAVISSLGFLRALIWVNSVIYLVFSTNRYLLIFVWRFLSIVSSISIYIPSIRWALLCVRPKARCWSMLVSHQCGYYLHWAYISTGATLKGPWITK